MRKSFANAFVFCILFTMAGQARAEIIWRGDFQTGDRSQWTSMEAVSSSRLPVVTNPVPDGFQYALQVTVNQGDTVYGGDRSEVDYETDRPGEGDERYYHWKTYFPSDFQSANYWQLFTQWHQYVSGGSPPLAFMAWGEKIQLGNDQDVYFWNAPLERGVWHDFVFHVIWSTDSSVGGIELWYDGEHQLPLTHTATLFPDDTVYLKQGLYRKNVISWAQTIYHCGMTVATQLSDVMNGAPPPVDAGTPTQPDGGTHSSADAGSHQSVDAGPIVGSDAGVAAQDAGATPDTSGGASTDGPLNAGCQSSGTAWLASLGFALLILWQRRRVRAA